MTDQQALDLMIKDTYQEKEERPPGPARAAFVRPAKMLAY
jgi:hypothetical protein